MLANESLELADERGVATFAEITFDPLLEAGKPKLLQAGDLALGERLVREIGKWPSPRESKRLDELSIRYELLEALEIELPWLDAQLVSRGAGDDAVSAQSLAELGDIDLERFLRRPRGSLAPERLDQMVTRDDAVRVEQKDGEQCPLLGRADVDRAAVVQNLQWTQDSELHCASADDATTVSRQDEEPALPGLYRASPRFLSGLDDSRRTAIAPGGRRTRGGTMLRKALITVVIAGALTGAQAAMAQTPEAMHEDGFDRAVAAQAAIWMAEDGFDRAVAAADRLSQPALRHSDSVEGALAQSRAQSIALRHSDSIDGALAQSRAQSTALRHSDSVDGALAAANASQDRIAVQSTGSGAEIEWPQIGIGLSVGVLLGIGLLLAVRATRIRRFAH